MQTWTSDAMDTALSILKCIFFTAMHIGFILVGISLMPREAELDHIFHIHLDAKAIKLYSLKIFNTSEMIKQA